MHSWGEEGVGFHIRESFLKAFVTTQYGMYWFEIRFLRSFTKFQILLVDINRLIRSMNIKFSPYISILTFFCCLKMWEKYVEGEEVSNGSTAENKQKEVIKVLHFNESQECDTCMLFCYFEVY